MLSYIMKALYAPIVKWISQSSSDFLLLPLQRTKVYVFISTFLNTKISKQHLAPKRHPVFMGLNATHGLMVKWISHESSELAFRVRILMGPPPF